MLNPTCNCRTVDKTVHYLFDYLNFANERPKAFNKHQSTDESILTKMISTLQKGLSLLTIYLLM